MSYLSFTKAYRKTTYLTTDPSCPELSAKGKTVIITGGGANSIGSEIAMSFAKTGAVTIAVVGKTEKTSQETKTKVETAYSDATVFVAVADIPRAEGIDKAAYAIEAELGAWDIFVNAAAYLPQLTTIADANEDDWLKAFEVSVKFSHFFAKHCLPQSRTGGTYISLNVGATHVAAAYIARTAAYSAAKIAVARLDEFLAMENPAFRVFTLHPGIVDTQTFRRMTAEQVATTIPQTDDMSLPTGFCV